jgi:hypothetical protein
MNNGYIEKTRYELTKSVFDDYFIEIEQLVKNSSFPNTAKALLRFVRKIEEIKNGLSFMVNEKNLYTASILLRCLFEHEIVAYYIWTKYRIENNDACGTHYYIDYFVSEQFKRERYNLSLEGISKNLETKQNLESLKIKLPFLEDASQKDIEKISTIAYQFDIRDIAKYLHKEVPKTDSYSEVNQKVILNALFEYNQLSSFVHGGPTSEYTVFEKYSVDEIETNLVSIKDFAYTGSGLIMELLIMFLADEHQKYFEIIEKISLMP